ncbi:hypothetical protein [uncultured Maribacter sp.]|uniref:hypothetical protein n=1 Tax=uncultured Maribacter sp. TaxID=431308 RepID=UPI00263A34DF|nr:hypothetical protein [uncultured Maribacter sp.]
MLSTITQYSPQALITAPKIHTDLLWDLTILFVSLAVLYFVGIFYFRNKFSKQNKIIAQKKTDLSPIISEFLFFEDSSSKDEKKSYIKLKIEIRQFLKDTFNRRILSEVLLDLGKDVSGRTQQSLFELYRELELHKDAYKKLESWRWELISKGIFELTQMHVEESYGFIIKFINDKRGTIRKQAEIATVTLKNEGIIHFLDTTRYKISEWQQLKLLEVLRNQKDFQPPKFKQWLTSGNKHVVLFSLRLIKHYNQNDAELSIIELVKHKNTQIKQEAIQCIKEFAFLKAIDTLKLVFWNCSADTKIAILGAMAVIGSEEDLPFLSQIEFKERNFSVKSKALSTINTIAPETILPTEDIETDIHHNIPEDIETAIAASKAIATTPNDIESMEREKDVEETLNNTIEPSTMDDNNVKEVLQEIRTEELQSFAENIDAPIDENINLDFLPIISSEESHEPLQNDKTNEEIKDIIVNFQRVVGKKINDLDVVYDAVSFLSKSQDFIEFNLDFLPLVTEKKKVSDLKVFYEEVPDIIYDNNFSKEKEEEINLDFIPVVFDEINTTDKPASVEKIDSQNIKNIVTIYEEIKVEEEKQEVKEIDLKEYDVDFTTLFNKKEETKSAPDHIEYNIPKASFYSEKELEMFVVLEDIDAFGDAREIPLLKEYLSVEKEGPVKERILEVMAKIHQENNQNKEIGMAVKEEEYISEVNLIEELFINSDTESKLILLDEIVAVGEKKELKLLNNLLSDPDKTVRQKALKCIAQLQNQINLKENLVIDLISEEVSPEPIPLEYAFLNDYEAELIKNNAGPSKTLKDSTTLSSSEGNKKDATFLEQFYMFSSKLFDRLNG